MGKLVSIASIRWVPYYRQARQARKDKDRVWVIDIHANADSSNPTEYLSYLALFSLL